MNNLGWKVGLAASLAVNLFVVGMAVGALGQRHRAVEMRRGPVPGAPLMRIGERLPEDKQAAFRERMRQTAEGNRAEADAARAARQRVAEVFSAPQFDAAAANQALAAARQTESAMRATMEGAVVEFAKTLGPDDRKALARGLNRPPGRGGGRGRSMGNDGRGFGPPGDRGEPRSDAPPPRP